LNPSSACLPVIKISSGKSGLCIKAEDDEGASASEPKKGNAAANKTEITKIKTRRRAGLL